MTKLPEPEWITLIGFYHVCGGKNNFASCYRTTTEINMVATHHAIFALGPEKHKKDLADKIIKELNKKKNKNIRGDIYVSGLTNRDLGDEAFPEGELQEMRNLLRESYKGGRVL